MWSAEAFTVRTDPVRDWTDFVIVFGQLGAMAVAVCGLLFLAKQVRLAREATDAANRLSEEARDAEIRRRTADLHDHLMSPPFMAMNSRVIAFLDVENARDAVSKVRAWREAPHSDAACLPRSPRVDAPMASKNDVNHVLGFFETMGAQKNLLDMETITRSFGPNPGYLFAVGWWYICWRREGKLRSPTAGATYCEFEDLIRVLFHHKPGFRDICVPDASVRFLVLPSPDVTDDASWDLCAGLSESLSQSLDPLNCLAGLPTSSAVPRPIVGRVVAVPADLSFNLLGWGMLVDSAEELEARMQRMDPAQLAALVADPRA